MFRRLLALCLVLSLFALFALFAPAADARPVVAFTPDGQAVVLDDGSPNYLALPAFAVGGAGYGAGLSVGFAPRVTFFRAPVEPVRFRAFVPAQPAAQVEVVKQRGLFRDRTVVRTTFR